LRMWLVLLVDPCDAVLPYNWTLELQRACWGKDVVSRNMLVRGMICDASSVFWRRAGVGVFRGLDARLVAVSKS